LTSSLNCSPVPAGNACFSRFKSSHELKAR
jgi:hypothetical protein